ncbi:MAG: hypothetical protein CSA62_04600 [Planctomycetota bacterium]|nr:MAG: hypothetical protein CSA62_04600 [Planctomycetota bacterium]
MRPIRALFLISLSAGLLSASALPQERTGALSNKSFVETCPPPLQRRLDAGLQALRKGDAQAASAQLLVALRDDAESPQLQYGDRETRRFHDVLESILSKSPPKLRAGFCASLEQGAQQALARASLDPEALRRILLKFPGTNSAAQARLRLCDSALERGQIAAAAYWLRRLAPDLRKPRAQLLSQLLHKINGPHPQPYGLGRLDGSSIALDCSPKEPSPSPLLLQALPWLVPGHVGQVLGQDESGTSFLVAQTPLDAVWIHPVEGTVQSLQLPARSGIPPGQAERPTPSLSGSMLYVVHGTGDADALRLQRRLRRRFSRQTQQLGSALLAISLGEKNKPRLLWKWRPELPPSDKQPSTATVALHPHALALQNRVYVLFSSLDESLRRQVWAACLDDHGKLLWRRFLAQGAPVTRDLIESRQEELGSGRHVPAAPIFADGMLVFSTGLGIVCGLDPLRGEMHWSFRTARISALGSKQGPWHEGRLARSGEEIYFAPSDGTWLYRLRSRAGQELRLAATPRPRRSMTRLLGVSRKLERLALLRQGLVECAPVQIRSGPLELRGKREDALPIQPGEFFRSWAMTENKLWLATQASLYELDLERDLFYSRLLELRPLQIGGIHGLAPTNSGLVILSQQGVWLWR